jgi:hypothetical protein
MATDLTVLTCPQCGGVVPLVEGATASCLFCHAPVPIPDVHQALRAQVRADHAAYELARQAATRIIPAPRSLRLLRWMVEGGAYWGVVLLVAPLILLGSLLSMFEIVIWLRDTLHFDFIGRFGATGMLMAFAFIATFGVGFLPLLATLGRRRAQSRVGILSALSARCSKRSDLLECRVCGAPLEIEGDGLTERCVYCGADNLRRADVVDLSRKNLARDQLITTVVEAQVADDRERADVSRRLRRRLLVMATIVLAFGAVGLAEDCGGATNQATRVGLRRVLPESALFL